MNRMDFIGKVAAILNGATKQDVKVVLEATGRILEEEIISKRERVKLFDYMYISGYEKPGGKRKNLYTGGMVNIPPHLQPHCEFTASFKRKYRQQSAKNR